MKLNSEDFFAFADLLGMRLRRDRRKGHDQLSGAVDLKLNAMLGLPWPFTVKLTDSGVYEKDGVVGVAANVMGALHLVMLLSVNEPVTGEYLRLWLVDARLTGGKVQPFGPTWNERHFYESFADGVVVGFRRDLGAKAPWVEVKAAQKHLFDAIRLAAPDALAQANVISNKFRTKGPRDRH